MKSQGIMPNPTPPLNNIIQFPLSERNRALDLWANYYDEITRNGQFKFCSFWLENFEIPVTKYLDF